MFCCGLLSALLPGNSSSTQLPGQVLVMGKISQAAMVAGAAYRNQETFRHQTGIANSRLIRDKRFHDTKVPVLLPDTQK